MPEPYPPMTRRESARLKYLSGNGSTAIAHAQRTRPRRQAHRVPYVVFTGSSLSLDVPPINLQGRQEPYWPAKAHYSSGQGMSRGGTNGPGKQRPARLPCRLRQKNACRAGHGKWGQSTPVFVRRLSSFVRRLSSAVRRQNAPLMALPKAPTGICSLMLRRRSRASAMSFWKSW